MKILQKIALSSLAATSLFASVESDAYLEYLLSQMYPSLNKAPSIVVQKASNSVNLSDANGTTINFTLSDPDNDNTSLQYLVTQNKDICDIVVNDNNITVTKKDGITIESGSSKEVEILLSAYDGDLYSTSATATVIFTNPKNATSPSINITDDNNIKFTSNKEILEQNLTYTTNDTNNTIFVDLNDTDSLKAEILNDTTIKLTRLTADAKDVQVTVYATSQDGLTESNSTKVNLEALILPPFLSIATTATTYTSDTNWSVTIPYSTYSKTDGNVTLDKDSGDNATVSPTGPTKNDTIGEVTISGQLVNNLTQGESTTENVSLKARLGSDESEVSEVSEVVITIMNKNLAPTLSLDVADSITIDAMGSKTLSFSADDKNTNDDLNVTATSSDESIVTVSVDNNNSTITLTTQPKVGTATISASVSDGELNSTIQTFTINSVNTLASLVENLRVVPIMNDANESNASIVSNYDFNLTNASMYYNLSEDSIDFSADNIDTTKLSYNNQTATFDGNTSDKAIMFNSGFTYIYNYEEKTARTLQIGASDTNKTFTWPVATQTEICNAGYSPEAIDIINSTNTNSNTVNCNSN